MGDDSGSSGARARPSRRSLLVGTAVLVPLAAAALAGNRVVGSRGGTVFHEEFGRDAAEGSFSDVYGDRLRPYPAGWRDTSGVGTYRPDLVLSVRDGVLQFRLQLVDGEPVAAAVVPVLSSYGQLYGRYTVRVRADPVPGWKIAFLLWPDSEKWPDDGEIDFPDSDLPHSIGAFLHHADPRGTVEEFGTDATLQEWHEARIEWSPDLVEFFLDDRLVGSSTTGVPHRSMHFVLQTETSTSATQADGRPVAEALVQVDRVTIEEYPWT